MIFEPRLPFRFLTPEGHLILVSIQANHFVYCSPKDDLGDLHNYTAVEMALSMKTGEGEGKDFCMPSDVGIEGYDELWGGDSVAAYVPIQRAMDLLQAFVLKYGQAVLED